MLKKFNVVKVRFHIEEKQILVLQGWKYEMPEEESLTVLLDGKELPWTMKKYDGMEVRQRYMIYDLGIEEEYFLYVTLPDNLQDYQELVLLAGGQPVYQNKSSSLLRQQKELDLFVEQTVLEKGKCYIKGWAASMPPVKVRAFGPGGRELSCEISWHERRDVAQVYREIENLPDAGFEIILPHHGLSQVKLEFSNGSRRTQTRIPVVTTFLFENMMGSSYLGKGMRFLQRHGMKEFCTRTMQVLMQKSASQGDYEKYRQSVMPSEEELERQCKEIWDNKPLFSIVVPLYKTPEKYLEQLVESIQSQTYDNWELCLSDGSGAPSPLEPYLCKLEQRERRVKIIRHTAPLKISDNTNAAIEKASGDYIVFSDHDDLLTRDALYECALALKEHPETELIYSDEDKISMNGKRYFEPHFKSDYNPDLLCSMNYFCHLVVAER